MVAPGNIGWFYLLVVPLNLLLGVAVQPQNMGTCAAGRTEFEGAVGFMGGNMLKRICTVAWCLTGFAAVAHYSGVALLGLLAYGAVTMFLGAVTKRPIVIGVLLLYGWQRVATAVPGLIDFLTVQKYTDTLLPALAEERGKYSTYEGSKWDRGLLPMDTNKLVAQSRGAEYCDFDDSATFDWAPVREAVAKHGMRNSNVMAIAPTATISNIAGSYQSIAPTYRNLFVKSNLSGDFTITNEYLVNDLKDLGLWDEQMLDDLKYYDGSLQHIDRVPEDLKHLYKTAFEIDIFALVACTARRQKWIDMGISFNLYIDQPSGKLLNDMYMACWKQGLKTTYYLRGQGATRIEKSTTKAVGDTSKQIKKASAPASPAATAAEADNNAALALIAANEACLLLLDESQRPPWP